MPAGLIKKENGVCSGRESATQRLAISSVPRSAPRRADRHCRGPCRKAPTIIDGGGAGSSLVGRGCGTPNFTECTETASERKQFAQHTKRIQHPHLRHTGFALWNQNGN